MILASLLLTIWLLTEKLCKATSVPKQDDSDANERQNEGPILFRTCPIWGYGYSSFKIKIGYPQYNDYHTEFATNSRLTTLSLDPFKKYFSHCDGSLKRNEIFVFPENQERKEELQPEIFVRPLIEQVLDMTLYKNFTVAGYTYRGSGTGLMTLRFGYFELSKMMADPNSNIWKKFEIEADDLLHLEWNEKLKQSKSRNQDLENEFKDGAEKRRNLENQCNELVEKIIPGHKQYLNELSLEKNQLINDIEDVQTDISDLKVRIIEVRDSENRLFDGLTTVLNSASRLQQGKQDVEDAMKVAEESNRKTRAEQILLEKNVETVKAVNEKHQITLKLLQDESQRLQSNMAELGTVNDTLKAGKQKAEAESMRLTDEVNELNERNIHARQEIQTVEGVYKELKNGVFTKENMENVAFNCLTTEYIENKWGIPPFLVNVLVLAVIVVLLLILLIIWKSRKPKCTCKNKATEDFDNGDEAETPKRPSAGSSVNGARKHFVVDMDNNEDEEASAGQMNPNYRPNPMQSHIRPILCRAKPAMFVSEE